MSSISTGTTSTTGYVVTSDTTGALVVKTGSGNTTAVTIDASQNTTLVGSLNSPNTFGFKNRIINGAMTIDQRNNGASITPTADGAFTVDRWKVAIAQASKYSVQQNAGSVTPPTGYAKYLGATSLSAYTLLTADYFAIYQPIEGLNAYDLAWGTAAASTITLSFWVRSSLTGTFSGSLYNGGGSTQSYVFNYTITSASTWENKTITVPGPTTGTWNVNNTEFLQVRLGLGTGATYVTATTGSWITGNYVQSSGSTSVVGTNGATFYVTGVQLEKGSIATGFDYRAYSTELAMCQRYLPCFTSTTTGSNTQVLGFGSNYSSTGGTAFVPFQVTPRVAPTAVTTIGTFTMAIPGTGTYTVSSIGLNTPGINGSVLNWTGSGMGSGTGALQLASTTAQIQFTGCEL